MATPPPSQSSAGYSGAQGLDSGSAEFNLWDFLIRQVLGRTATLMPALVKAVHIPDTLDGTGTVDVQPMVNQLDGQGNPTPHGTIFNVPYLRIQGGTNAVIIDPAVGDIGVIACCSRDISKVKATRTVANPGSRRTYDWADGLYIGGWLNGVPTQYVRMSAAGIEVVSPVAVTVTATGVPVTVNAGTVAVNATTSATVTTPQCNLISDNVNLGNTGGKKIALDGDSVVANKVVASSTKVKAV